MMILLLFSLILLTALVTDYEGVFTGFIMVTTDFVYWYRHDMIPLTTNPDAYASTVAAPWFGQGRVTH